MNSHIALEILIGNSSLIRGNQTIIYIYYYCFMRNIKNMYSLMVFDGRTTLQYYCYTYCTGIKINKTLCFAYKTSTTLNTVKT